MGIEVASPVALSCPDNPSIHWWSLLRMAGRNPVRSNDLAQLRPDRCRIYPVILGPGARACWTTQHNTTRQRWQGSNGHGWIEKSAGMTTTHPCCPKKYKLCVPSGWSTIPLPAPTVLILVRSIGHSPLPSYRGGEGGHTGARCHSPIRVCDRRVPACLHTIIQLGEQRRLQALACKTHWRSKSSCNECTPIATNVPKCHAVSGKGKSCLENSIIFFPPVVKIGRRKRKERALTLVRVLVRRSKRTRD